jgi:hypothetical protein
MKKKLGGKIKYETKGKFEEAGNFHGCCCNGY